MSERRLGEKSTHDVKCVVCDQTFGNACQHRCPFAGVDHANMHRETQRQLLSLAARLVELEDAFLAQARLLAEMAAHTKSADSEKT